MLMCCEIKTIEIIQCKNALIGWIYRKMYFNAFAFYRVPEKNIEICKRFFE